MLKDSELTVQAAPELLRCDKHAVVRGADESDDDYASRTELFALLLRLARQNNQLTA